MKINILSLGKFKLNQQYRDIFEYYKKRIKVNINLIELKTFQPPKKINLEKNELLKFIENDDYVIVLDQYGENISSTGLAKIIKQKMENGCKKINFIIGSEEGLDNHFKISYKNISFGNQTWPHLLIRVMLIEQIYRAFEIMKKSHYHK